jgi:hypothetical protein
MTIPNLFLGLGLMAAGLCLADAYAELSRGDVERRLAEVYNNPFAHLAALLFELFHHLGGLARRQDPSRHGEGAAAAVGSLLILVMTPILTAGVAEPSQLAQRGVSLTIATIVWSVVIEVPGQRPRMPHLILIVLALDITVMAVALSGVIQGAEASAFISELAAIGAAHVVSVLLSLKRLSRGDL